MLRNINITKVNTFCVSIHFNTVYICNENIQTSDDSCSRLLFVIVKHMKIYLLFFHINLKKCSAALHSVTLRCLTMWEQKIDSKALNEKFDI